MNPPFQPTVSLDRAIFNACYALCQMAGTQLPDDTKESLPQTQKRGCDAIQVLRAAGIPTDASVAAQINAAIGVLSASLSVVAFSGEYADLLNKPAIGAGTVTSVTLALPAPFTNPSPPVTGAGILSADFPLATDKIFIGVSNVPTAVAVNVYNVIAYGADRTGSADSTTAITNAVAAAVASGGGTVYFPAGTYKRTAQVVIGGNNIRILGYGVIFTSNTEAQHRVFGATGRSNLVFDGFTCDGIHTAGGMGIGTAALEFTNCTDVKVINCTFIRQSNGGLYLLGNCARFIINNNLFDQFFTAIFVDDDTVNQATFLKITNNTFRRGYATTSEAYSGAIKISGIGSILSIAGHTITGNTIDLPGQMGIEMQTWVNDCVVSMNTVNGAGYGISFSGIARINGTGNIVNGADGIGVECASTCSDISLSNTYVNGKDASGASTTAIGVSVDQSSNITITGGEIGFCGTGYYAQNVATALENLTIAGVAFRENGGHITIKSAQNWSITGCNLISHGTNTYTCLTLDASNANMANGKFSDNKFTGATSNSGILLYTGNSNTISLMEVSNNNTSGVTFGTAGAINVQMPFAQITKFRCFNNTASGARDDTAGNVFIGFNVGAIGLYASLDLTAKQYWVFENALIRCDASGGAISLTLPAATNMGGWSATVVKNDSSTNAVTLVGTINGVSNFVLANQWDAATVGSDAGSWILKSFRTDETIIQDFSIPIVKKFTFAVAANAGDQWFKIFSKSYGIPLTMALHVQCNFLVSADNTASAQTFWVAGSPYGQAAGIMKLPDGTYNTGVLKGIIYDNPSGGAVQDIWLRFAPTAGGNVTVGGADLADGWITAPSAVTSSPTYDANHYELDTQSDRSALKSRYIQADQFNLVAGGYCNFSTTRGSTGYGFRDNAGTMEAKDSGGSWAKIAKQGDSPTFAQLRTNAPAGGTAANWKLGIAAAVSPTSPNRTIEVDIGGTIFYIAAKTTND